MATYRQLGNFPTAREAALCVARHRESLFQLFEPGGALFGFLVATPPTIDGGGGGGGGGGGAGTCAAVEVAVEGAVEGEWSCALCTLHNALGATRCKACGVARGTPGGREARWRRRGGVP